MDNSKIIFIGIGVFVVCIFLFVFFTMLSRSSKKIETTSNTSSTPKLSDLDSMLYALEQESTSEEDIFKIVEKFLQTQKMEKKSPNPSDTCKKQLDFVTKVASHKNSNAKIIARLNVKLKEANPEYHKEIEMCEALGVMRRR